MNCCSRCLVLNSNSIINLKIVEYLCSDIICRALVPSTLGLNLQQNAQLKKSILIVAPRRSVSYFLSTTIHLHFVDFEVDSCVSSSDFV